MNLTDLLTIGIHKMSRKKFNYISILAGGSCSFNCDFCIGNDVRSNVTPHFSHKYKSFLELFAQNTNLLSISGSTSDPSLIGTPNNYFIVETARMYNRDIKISMHTRDLGEFAKEAYSYCDEVVISLEKNTPEAIKFFEELSEYQQSKTRISVVITQENKHLLVTEEFYESLSISSFTLRKNVFEPIDINIEFAFGYEGKYGSTFYDFKDGKIAYWDYSVTNVNLETRYLWDDGEVSSQCRWEELH